MNALLIPLIKVIDIVLSLYTWALIISAVMSWLVAFDVVNRHNQFVSTIGSFLHQITEPLLVRVRRFVPVMGTVDLAPLVLILAIWFLRMVLAEVAMSLY